MLFLLTKCVRNSDFKMLNFVNLQIQNEHCLYYKTNKNPKVKQTALSTCIVLIMNIKHI